jgi:hypothetical protein
MRKKKQERMRRKRKWERKKELSRKRLRENNRICDKERHRAIALKNVSLNSLFDGLFSLKRE